MSRFSVRICAWLVAYALVLHGLAASMSLATAHAFNEAPFAGAISCKSSAIGVPAGQDPRQDESSCVQHCLLVGAADNSAPPLAGFLGKLAPATRIAAPALFELPKCAATSRPQSPRAPPLA